MMRIGAASVDITPPLGRPIQGASVNQVATSVRDPLEAGALYLEQGGQRVLLISCDLVGLETAFIEATARRIEARTGVERAGLWIACTHTHAGPAVIDTSFHKPVDHEYYVFLGDKLVEVSASAAAAAVPGQLGWAAGQARIGYNRRTCWLDGRHEMHGNANHADCTGLEGPDDPAHLAIFARDAAGKVRAVLQHNTSHPTTFYGRQVWSSDFPGVSRAQLRAVLGPAPVLFFNGCQGDVAQSEQHGGGPRRSSESLDQMCARAAHLLTGETLRLLHQVQWHDELPMAITGQELVVDVRLPAADRLAWSGDILKRARRGDDVPVWEVMRAYQTDLLQRAFGENPRESLHLGALRLGELALVSQPCELFCQFGLDIKRRSPAAATAVVGLANGYSGYCPTAYGPLGGGYSGETLYGTRLAADTGYRIVDAAAAMLKQLFSGAQADKVAVAAAAASAGSAGSASSSRG